MLVPFDDVGSRRIIAALRGGEPVVLPPLSPVTYCLAGTDPARINTAKGRPTRQPTAIGITRLDAVEPCLDVGVEVIEFVGWLAFRAKLAVLVPTSGAIPDWLAPATVDGAVLLAGAWLPETRPIVESVPHLYVSSGNRTARDPHATAAAADREFDGALPVLDGDALRLPGLPHGATTMVRVGPRVEDLWLVRHGVNDRDFDQGDSGPFLDQLRREYSAYRRSGQDLSS
jgi:hypothetical protein